MKEAITLLIADVEYTGHTDIDGNVPVNITVGVNEDTGIEYVTVSIVLDEQTITNDYSLDAIPSMTVIGDDGKIIYLDDMILSKLDDIENYTSTLERNIYESTIEES